MESSADRRDDRGPPTGKRPISNDNNHGQAAGLKGWQKKRARNAIYRTMTPSGAASKRIMTAENFAEVRAFEINAMHNAMRNSKLAGNKRVFQTLPRHLRRRAASHQPKRLPMEKAPSIATGVDKHGHRKKRRRPGAIIKEYERRQEKKRWLETHIWHAKRMKMIDQWGYRLAATPNDKSQRAAYRASAHIAMMQDVSYMGCIELEGPQLLLKALLDRICTSSVAGPSSPRFLAGSRQCTCTLHKPNEYPQQMIAPVMVLWKPLISINDQLNESVTRHVWLWIHPSAFDQAYQLLDELKTNNQLIDLPQLSTLIIRDLRSELLVFDFIGPRSHHFISSVLDICCNDDANSSLATPSHTATLWRTLDSLRTTQSLPPGAVIGLTVHDPRLRFPQKVKPINLEDDQDNTALSSLLVNWPDHISDTAIWDAEVRQTLYDAMLPEKELNARRSMQLVPSEPLVVTASDARVPILLVQRGGNSITVPDTQIGRELVNGWRLIMPKGWGNIFWKSFVFTGLRASGLQEQRTIHLEAGLPCFPYDYPGLTGPGQYEKRPPAKRPNYEKFNAPSPFDPPFSLLTTRTTTPLTTNTSRCYSVSGSTVRQCLTKALTKLPVKRNTEAATTLSDNEAYLDASSIGSSALVRVRVNMLSRGTVGRNAIIYAFDASTLLNNIPTIKASSRTSLRQLASVEVDGELFCTTHKDQILGYVTTGQLVFSQGKGSAIGSCSVTRLLSHLTQQHAILRSSYVVLVREPHSFTCRFARLEIID
ncbi:ribonucleases P/MRP protein subunit POP1-domain-containing protein [Syncephalis fuscata]|nr:ribonucleases P/MRP protein subunit POP1-domain-containing protein [Syncephalis fuscata]